MYTADAQSTARNSGIPLILAKNSYVPQHLLGHVFFLVSDYFFASFVYWNLLLLQTW